VIVDVDGKPMAAGVLESALKRKKAGDRLIVTYKRRGGSTGTASIEVKDDPTLELVPIETIGGTLSPDQKAFRDAWLGSKHK
jgi:predicted metalloprotease with PDZ domain